MSQYNRKKKLNLKDKKLMFVLLFGTLIYLFVSNMLYAYDRTSIIFDAKYSTVIMFSMISIACFGLFLNVIHNKKIPRIIWIATGFAIFSTISTLLNYNTQNQNIFITLANQLFWWSICIIGFLTFNKNNNVKYINTFVFVFYVIISVLYFQYATNTNGYLLPTSIMINSIYYMLLFLPFILMFKQLFVKFFCISIMVFATFFSQKRTAVLVLFASIGIYYIVNYFISGKKIAKKLYVIASLFIIVLITIYIYNYILQKYNIDYLLRVQDLVTDGGSGRNVIYEIVWDEICKFNFSSWLIGRGFNGVLLTSGIGLSAHNDFLEVLFDYGIIGLLIYLMFLFNIINYNFILIKIKSEYAGAYSASVLFFIIMSMTSHLIIYPTYFMLLILFWMWQIVNVEMVSENNNIKNMTIKKENT